MQTSDFDSEKIKHVFSSMDYLRASEIAPEKYQLLDVRSGEASLKKIKIPGALEIPLAELETRSHELPKNKTIVIYCWDVWSNAPGRAALSLKKKGFTVKRLSEGINGWQRMGLPVESLL